MEDATLPMSDLRRSGGSRDDAFSSWPSPRDAAFGMVESRRSLQSQRRGRWLGVMALACSIAIHLGLLFGLCVSPTRETDGAARGQTPVTALQVRFIKIRLDADSRAHASTSTLPTTMQKHSAIVMAPVVPAMKVTNVPSVSAKTDVVATPAVTEVSNAPPRSDDWNAQPADQRNAGPDGYVQAPLQGDANLMKHSTGGVTYKATRFDSSWAPDRQNAIAHAIDRATFHAMVKLAAGVQLDCAGGPSSPEPLRTSIAVLAIASTRCHGSSPSAPVAAKSLIDIQTLATASEPPNSASAPGRSANKADCGDARVASEKLPPNCHTAAPNTTAAGESGGFLGTTPANKPPEPPSH